MKLKKFKYRLEQVLQYREVIRAEKLRVLTLRNRELADARERLQALETDLLKNSLPDGEITVDQLLLIGSYSQRLRQEIDAQRVTILDCETKAEEARVEYIEAVKEAESLQKHRANKLTEYNEFVEKKMQEYMHELSVHRIGQLKFKAGVETQKRDREDELEPI